MATRFLRSKTTPPSLHHEAVVRSRLADRLAASTGPLILVSAPAGYGKTTLLVQAFADHPAKIVWVTVDAADNDPMRFWTHVAAAVLGEGPELDTIASELAGGEHDRQAVIDALIARIEAETTPLILILDDLHEVVSPEILDALGRILSSPPENLRVVASTRSDPALPTGRLRAQGRLTEIRANDLAFTIDEASAFFSAAPATTVQAIVERTEGWPTALRLLDVASASGRDGKELLETAALSSPDLADFLSTEALGVQRRELQQFLVETSILQDLTPIACDVVTGRAGSLSLLRELAANQVFTTLVDPASSTYRYHHVFRDFLRSQALELPKDKQIGLAQRGANLFAEQGEPSQAIRLALLAENYDMAAELILANSLLYSQSGWIATVFDWLNAYGLDRCRNHADLSLLTAWAMLNMHRYEEMLEWLSSPALVEPLGSLNAQIAAVRSHWKRHIGDAIGALAEAERGVSLLDDDADDDQLQSVLAACAGIAKLLAGHDPTIELQRAASIGLATGVDSSTVVGYAGLGLLASCDPQRLDEAEAFADQALEFCSTPALVKFHQPAAAYITKARVHVARGRVGDATECATRARAIADAGQEPLFELLANLELCRASHLQGDAESTRSHLREAEALLTEDSGQHLAESIRRVKNETRFASLDRRNGLPVAADGLTERELGVLRLLPHGLSRKELAAQLFISENTLKTHLTSIRHKLGVSGREDLAARATELGII